MEPEKVEVVRHYFRVLYIPFSDLSREMVFKKLERVLNGVDRDYAHEVFFSWSCSRGLWRQICRQIWREAFQRFFREVCDKLIDCVEVGKLVEEVNWLREYTFIN